MKTFPQNLFYALSPPKCFSSLQQTPDICMWMLYAIEYERVGAPFPQNPLWGWTLNLQGLNPALSQFYTPGLSTPPHLSQEFQTEIEIAFCFIHALHDRHLTEHTARGLLAKLTRVLSSQVVREEDKCKHITKKKVFFWHHHTVLIASSVLPQSPPARAYTTEQET